MKVWKVHATFINEMIYYEKFQAFYGGYGAGSNKLRE